MATKYEKSLESTRVLRSSCAPIFLPLFDHMLVLAADSHKRGYFKRAGQELRHARKVAGYAACPDCGQAATVTGACSVPCGA